MSQDFYSTWIGIAGLFLSLCTFVVGLWIGRKWRAEDARNEKIQSVVDEYRRLYDARLDGGINGLVKSGIANLRNSEEITEAIDRIQGHGIPHPIGDKRFQRFDLKGMFTYIAKHRKHPMSVKDYDELLEQLEASVTKHEA